jgi:hypothetical protein
MAPPSWLEWAESATRKKHVKIADVARMKMYDKATILCLDRNFGDFVYNLATKQRKKGQTKVVVDVRDLLKTCYVFEYQHMFGLCGIAKWQGDWAEDRAPEIFEWDIEYAPGSYLKLVNGCLPMEDCCTNRAADACPSWTTFPEDRRVGWRGPCLFIEDLANLPESMYYELD